MHILHAVRCRPLLAARVLPVVPVSSHLGNSSCSSESLCLSPCQKCQPLRRSIHCTDSLQLGCRGRLNFPASLRLSSLALSRGSLRQQVKSPPQGQVLHSKSLPPNLTATAFGVFEQRTRGGGFGVGFLGGRVSSIGVLDYGPCLFQRGNSSLRPGSRLHDERAAPQTPSNESDNFFPEPQGVEFPKDFVSARKGEGSAGVQTAETGGSSQRVVFENLRFLPLWARRLEAPSSYVLFLRVCPIAPLVGMSLAVHVFPREFSKRAKDLGKHGALPLRRGVAWFAGCVSSAWP